MKRVANAALIILSFFYAVPLFAMEASPGGDGRGLIAAFRNILGRGQQAPEAKKRNLLVVPDADQEDGNDLDALRKRKREEELCRCIRIVESSDEAAFSDLAAKIIAAKSKRVYSSVLDKVSSKFSGMSCEKRKQLLALAHDWALSHGQQERLAEGYSEFILSCETVSDEMVDIFLKFAQAAPRDALKTLETFTQDYVEEFGCVYPSFEFLQLVTMLKRCGSEKFDEYAQQILRDGEMRSLLPMVSDPARARKLEGTPFTPNQFIERIFEQALANKKGARGFVWLLQDGQSHHEQHQERIAASLPDFIAKNPSSHEAVMALFKSPSAELRESALSVLIEQLCTQEDYSCRRKYIDALLKSSEVPEGVEVPADVDELHRRMFTACKEQETPYDYGIQKLLVHRFELVGNDQLLVEMLRGYLNVSPDMCSSYAIGDLLQCALASKSIPVSRFAQIIATANDSKFVQYMPQEFLKRFKLDAIQDEAISLKERCQLLSDLLQAGQPADVRPLIEGLSDSAFKEYGGRLIEVLTASEGSKAYFAARRALIELSKKEVEFSAGLDIVMRQRGPLYSSLEAREESRDDQVHVSVQKSLKSPQFPTGQLFFGYVEDEGPDFAKKNYCLYACDKESGYPLWALPVTSSKQHPYAIFEDSVYCVTDEGGIIQYDLNSGEEKNRFDSPVEDEQTRALHITRGGILYHLKEKQVAIQNLKDGSVTTQTFPDVRGPLKFELVGEHLVAWKGREVRELFLIDKNGTRELPINNTRVRGNPKVVGDEHRLIYSRYGDARDDRSLICIDSNSGDPQWEFPFDSSLQGAPILSPDGRTLFVLTKKTLTALSTQILSDGKPDVLWKTPRTGIRNLQIVLSDDGTLMYGVETIGGKLYQFDTKTGKKTYLYGDYSGGKDALLGIFNNKLYMQKGFFIG